MKKSTRMLVPEEEKCIGCRACTSACPEEFINFSEEGNMRSISFPANCSSDCELCALACPENAISFVFPEGESGYGEKQEHGYREKKGKGSGEKRTEGVEKSPIPPESQALDFELLPCRNCGTPFATTRELEKVREAISEKVPLPPDGGFWVELCPGCRQATFRERQAETIIQARKL